MVHLEPNQRAVRIVKAESNSISIYGIYNKKATFAAMRALNWSGFKLWNYLNLNQSGYELGLSMKDVVKECGMNKNTYYTAVKELIDKGYLVEVELYPNLTGYLFIEQGYGGETEGT